jgi:urocanate hydratase
MSTPPEPTHPAAPRTESSAVPASSVVPSIEQVYRSYSSFLDQTQARFDGEFGGKLLLLSPFDSEGAALSLAANIAGAATLIIDADPQRLKDGIRHGHCDFLVNHLDEALRILKNEIRKRQPVSVALAAELPPFLAEVVERGVQPDLIYLPPEMPSVATLLSRDSLLLRAANTMPEDGRRAVRWTAAKAPALWLPRVDQLAAAVFPYEDRRRRWLQLAPRYLGRQMMASRFLEMSKAELDTFTSSVNAAIASGEIGAEIAIH